MKSSHPQRRGPLIPKSVTLLYLVFEFSFLFIIIPILLYVFRRGFAAYVIPVLLLLAGFCLTLLLFDPSFDRKFLINVNHFWPHFQKTVIHFIPWAAALAIAWGFYRPAQLFNIPGHSITLWLIVMIVYPLLSAYPQEIIFRTFLFHRYRCLFPNESMCIVVSSLTFALAHLFLANWIAPTLTVIGGFIFASTYSRTSSTLQASLVHSLWGNFIITIGMGLYFYGGSIS